MYKNNKILKAASGAPLVLGGIPAAAAVPEIIAGMGPLSVLGGLTALGIYNATHPHASRTYMQDLQALMNREEHDAFEAYKNRLARKYQEQLANGEYITPTGTHITSYNPDTMELSGYRIGDNGNIGYITKNVYTGDYGPSVYYDANTGAYYEGINTPYINTVEVSRGENLMPWSIIPTTTPVGLTFDNTIMATPLEGQYAAKKKKPQSNSGQAAASTESSTSEALPPKPDPDKKDDDNKDNWWKTIGKNFTNSFKTSINAIGAGANAGSNLIAKGVGFVLPFAGIGGIGYGVYKGGQHWGWWGEDKKQIPHKSTDNQNTYEFTDTVNIWDNLQLEEDSLQK